MFYCWHWYQSLTFLFVVGAPWRCGVLATLGGIAGVGLDWATCWRERERERARNNSPEWSGGSSRRKRIVAKENGASLDLIVVVFCFIVLLFCCFSVLLCGVCVGVVCCVLCVVCVGVNVGVVWCGVVWCGVVWLVGWLVVLCVCARRRRRERRGGMVQLLGRNVFFLKKAASCSLFFMWFCAANFPVWHDVRRRGDARSLVEEKCSAPELSYPKGRDWRSASTLCQLLPWYRFRGLLLRGAATGNTAQNAIKHWRL